MTSSFVNLGLAGKQPPKIETIYPSLFNEPGSKVSKEEQFKQELIAYAELFNMKNKNGGTQ